MNSTPPSLESNRQPASAAGLRAAPGSEKIFGVTHRGTDGETKAFLEDGRLWINDGVGGWMQCNPGVESYFSPNHDLATPVA